MMNKQKTNWVEKTYWWVIIGIMISGFIIVCIAQFTSQRYAIPYDVLDTKTGVYHTEYTEERTNALLALSGTLIAGIGPIIYIFLVEYI